MGQPDNTLTVVIAESDAELQKIISYALRPYTENIVMVHDGYEALAAIEEITPVLVFIDSNLPLLAASGLKEKLNARLNTSRMCVIVTSSYSKCDMVEWAHPACAILQKPFDVAALRAAIDEHLA